MPLIQYNVCVYRLYPIKYVVTSIIIMNDDNGHRWQWWKTDLLTGHPVLPVSITVWDLVKAVSSVEALWGLVQLNIIMNMCQRQLAPTEYSNKYTQPSASGLACQWRMSPLSFANLLMLSPVWNYLLLSGSMNHCSVWLCALFFPPFKGVCFHGAYVCICTDISVSYHPSINSHLATPNSADETTSRNLSLDWQTAYMSGRERQGECASTGYVCCCPDNKTRCLGRFLESHPLQIIYVQEMWQVWKINGVICEAPDW